jgi:hypothetical protein
MPAMRSALQEVWPQPNPRDMIVNSAGTILLASYLLNRDVSALALLLWPALLAAKLLANAPRRKALMLATLLPTVSVSFAGARRIALAGWVAASDIPYRGPSFTSARANT